MRIKKSLAEYTADALGEQIVVQKKYKTGDQLPNEIELAREFGVSRATLREAIRVLAVQGLLTVERGRGTFVNSEVKNYKDVQFGDIGSLRMKLIDLFELPAHLRNRSGTDGLRARHRGRNQRHSRRGRAGCRLHQPPG